MDLSLMRARLAGALLLALAGVAALGWLVNSGADVLVLRQQQCDAGGPATAPLSSMMLPAGILATLAFAASAVIAAGARRLAPPERRGGALFASILVFLTCLAAGFALWFGVYTTLTDTPACP